MKKLLALILLLILVLTLVYLLGPKEEYAPIERPEISLWNLSLDSLNKYVTARDATIPNLKPDNESRIVWADSLRKTRYSVVYLHGFSASPMESHPVHLAFAKKFGMNIYLPLLPGHGRDDRDSFLYLEPNELVAAAKEAIAIGQLIGEDVIVMSTSTGSTLAIYLASGNPEIIDALIMYSPNIELYDDKAKLITGPWGKRIVLSAAGKYRERPKSQKQEASQYWTTTYRNEGLIALQSLIDQTMTGEVFREISQPYFIGYYFKNEQEQDKTISVKAILDFNEETKTPDDLKKLVAFPEAGEHVIANPIKSNSVGAVMDSTIWFAEQVLQIQRSGSSTLH